MRPDQQQVAIEEGERLRRFLLERTRSGVDLRLLLIGHAAILGQMVATCAAPGYLEATAEILKSTIDYNVILMMPEAGHG